MSVTTATRTPRHRTGSTDPPSRAGSDRHRRSPAIGVSVLWLSIIVLLPLAALTFTALSGGLGELLGRRDGARGAGRAAGHAR